MLKQLQVQNYALIDSLTLELQSNLTAITGETGAGKSILLGALGHILGQRADLKSLRDQSKKCIIEASFHVADYQLERFFEQHDLDYSTTTILRREILPSGKSRAFVNDTPVQLAQMKQLGEKLVDIHSQHQTLQLRNQAFQLEIIDAFAHTEKALSEYKRIYKQFKKQQKELNSKREELQQIAKDQDYFSFQLSEFEGLELENIDQDELEQELSQLSHVEEIKSALFEGTRLLDGEEFSAIDQVKQALQELTKIANFGEVYEGFAHRLETVKIELQDLAQSVEQAQEQLEHDPERIQYLSDLQNRMYTLQQKHLVKTVEELIDVKTSLASKVTSADHLEETIHQLEKSLADTQGKLREAAEKLSEKRQKSFKKFEKEVHDLLAQLGMPHAHLEVDRTERETDPTGIDSIEFLFTANKGSRAQPIGDVASGGELSRLMLCLKLILSKLKHLPTIIFDEIDTGVSGNIATKIADLMREMGKQMQVITITHLPQVAAKGVHHVKVFKQLEKDVTTTNLKPLNFDERIHEISVMLSGEEPTDAAKLNAKELLAQNA